MKKGKEDKKQDTEVKVEVKNKDAGVDNKNSDSDNKKKKKKSDLEISEDKIVELEDKLKEAEDKHLRLFAEFDNFQKRTARKFNEMSVSGRAQIITQLLDVLDNFQRAIEAARNSSNQDSLLEGTELVYKNLFDILTKEGLEPIPAEGQPFDPNYHEALMQVESDEHPEGTIIQEMVKGYKLGEKVLRYSKVSVSKGPGEKDKIDDKSK